MENDSFYKPSRNLKDTKRTYVPDLYNEVAAEISEEVEAFENSDIPSNNYVKLQDRPMVGVLFSISAGIEGELFPVYVGRNIIGCDKSCDICLRETSISEHHGILLARKHIDDDGHLFINVLLSDTNSMYGTSVNGEKVVCDKIVCHDGDVLNFGQNYVLVLCLFNSLDKLTVAYGFDRIPEPEVMVEPPTQTQIPSNFIADMDNHSTNITQEINQEPSVDFYKPTKQQEGNHYNNKTIIL